MLKKAHVHLSAGVLALLAAVEAGTNVMGTALEAELAGDEVTGIMSAAPVVLLGVSAALSSFVQIYQADNSTKTPPPDA